MCRIHTRDWATTTRKKQKKKKLKTKTGFLLYTVLFSRFGIHVIVIPRVFLFLPLPLPLAKCKTDPGTGNNNNETQRVIWSLFFGSFKWIFFIQFWWFKKKKSKFTLTKNKQTNNQTAKNPKKNVPVHCFFQRLGGTYYILKWENLYFIYVTFFTFIHSFLIWDAPKTKNPAL